MMYTPISQIAVQALYREGQVNGGFGNLSRRSADGSHLGGLRCAMVLASALEIWHDYARSRHRHRAGATGRTAAAHPQRETEVGCLSAGDVRGLLRLPPH